MSNLEYRAVIKFLTKEGLTPTQIKERMEAVYKELSPSFTTIKNWSKLFRWGRESLDDDPRGGGPSTVVTSENVELVEEVVLSDSRLNAREIADQTGISKTSVHRILNDHLNMSKISGRWVIKLLSAVQKMERVTCCRKFLNMYHQDKKGVLNKIVTGDETMVLYLDPLSKQPRKGVLAPKKAKITQNTRKIMATIFWDCEGILLIDFKKHNMTVNATYYADLLRQLRQAIVAKRRGKLSRGVLLLHENTPVHTAAVFKAAVIECGFTELDHPPYSPDLAPSDYFLFPKLKSELRGKEFDTEEEIQKAVLDYFSEKDSTYFYNGLEALVKRCEKCIAVKGDYIEK